MRHLVAVAAVLACSTKKEPSQQQPPSRPAVLDAAAPTPSSSVTPCVVVVEIVPGGVTLSGGGISGNDVTALSKVAKTCSARLVPDAHVTFEAVATTLRLITEQGIDEVRLGQPLGQWMSMDLARVTKLWNAEPAAQLIAAVRERAPRMGAANAAIVERVASTIARARQGEPLGTQTSDRGLFEAVAQIVGLRRATAPVAIDLLERDVMPALEVRAATSPRADGEPFERFVARSSKPTGLLGAIPDAEQSTPYADTKPIELRDGDWVVIATEPLAARLAGFDQRKLVAQYDHFLSTSKLHDDDRILVETSARALTDLASCVATAVQNREALVFRVLPAPRVELSKTEKQPTVVITESSISVEGASAKRSVLSSLPQTSPRTIVLEADRSLPYGRIGIVAAALGTPGDVTFVLRPR